MEIVFVSGGSEGIGLETVKYFFRNNFRAVTCGRSPDKWKGAVENDSSLREVEFIQADISIQDDIVKLFNQIKRKYNNIDIAVNCASPDLKSEGRFSEQLDKDLIETISSDLTSHLLCMKQQLLIMKSGGRIVNVTSINGVRPTPGASAYSAAKYGLEGLTKSVALEAIKDGIRINSIAPGVTWTPRWEKRAKSNPSIKEDVSKLVPNRRFAEAKEIARAIAWLSSPDSSYIVGHTLVVDGGLSLK